MDKIKVFVGSSVGGLSHARAVKQNLDYDAWVRLWNQGISAPAVTRWRI
jgi:predicted nucleotide-binding protein